MHSWPFLDINFTGWRSEKWTGPARLLYLTWHILVPRVRTLGTRTNGRHMTILLYIHVHTKMDEFWWNLAKLPRALDTCVCKKPDHIEVNIIWLNIIDFTQTNTCSYKHRAHNSWSFKIVSRLPSVIRLVTCYLMSRGNKIAQIMQIFFFS